MIKNETGELTLKRISLQKLKSNKLARSMILSTACKPISMVISLLYTPVLLAYLGNENYGIWSTILSVINWVNYFDVGIGNGLRNILAKYIDNDEKKEAKSAVTTAYIALGTISGIVLVIGSLLILTLNMNAVFNTRVSVRPALLTSFVCICINFVLAISKVQLYAAQQAEKVGYMTLLTQVFNLCGILILSLFSHGNLLLVAIVIGLAGILVNVIFTGNIWKNYTYLIPAFSAFDTSKLHDICNVGIKFFAVQIATLVLYSTDNVIITQLFGPAYVTPYTTLFSVFGVANGLFAAMISPLWSKYSIALERKDYRWIKKALINQDKLLPLVALGLTFAVMIYEPFSRIWLHKTLDYTFGLIPCMGVYYFMAIWSSIYANAMNGMSRINLQMIMGIISAILNIPLSIFMGKVLGMGTTGVNLATVVCMFVTAVILTVDMHRYLNQQIKATGSY